MKAKGRPAHSPAVSNYMSIRICELASSLLSFPGPIRTHLILRHPDP